MLFEYNRWANHRLLQSASALTAEQFTRDLGGSFRSVRDTLVHIVGGGWGWLQYWKQPSVSPGFLKDLWARHAVLFSPDRYPDLAAIAAKCDEVETELAEFADHLTDESLKKLLPIRTAQVSLVHLMQHLVNHSTYHRGQVAAMLRQLGAQPQPTDFHLFLLEAPSRAAAIH